MNIPIPPGITLINWRRAFVNSYLYSSDKPLGSIRNEAPYRWHCYLCEAHQEELTTRWGAGLLLIEHVSSSHSDR